MSDQQVSIYVEPNRQGDWAATVLGELAGTISGASLEWCWATKYVLPWQQDPTSDGVPQSFKARAPDGSDVGAWVKLRYRIVDPTSFEASVQKISTSHGWHPAFAAYDLVADLGTDRFLAQEQPATPARRQQRAEQLAKFLHQALLLAADALVKDGNGWRFERNTDPQNPTGTTFQSIVHLVCNLTDARTQAVVRTPAGAFAVPVTF